MSTASPAGRIAEGVVCRFEGLAATRDRALGEGRQITRLAANSVRATHRGEIDEAERLLAEARQRMMTLAGGLRRTTDALRAVLERTRGDVTMAATQGRVEQALREALGAEIGLGMASAGDDDGTDRAPMG